MEEGEKGKLDMRRLTKDERAIVAQAMLLLRKARGEPVEIPPRRG